MSVLRPLGNGWHVSLTQAEMNVAAAGGALRQRSALELKLQDSHGKDGPGWSDHIEGVAGEMAVARLFDIYYDFSNLTFKNGGDVGVLQVRTRSQYRYDLLVRQNDRDDVPFVLVVGKMPELVVVGWLLGGEAKQTKWLMGYAGRELAYFVPQEELRQLSALCVAGSGLTMPYRRT